MNDAIAEQALAARVLAMPASTLAGQVHRRLGLRRSPRREAAAGIVEAMLFMPAFVRADLLAPAARLRGYNARTLERACESLLAAGVIETVPDTVTQGGGQAYRVRLEALLDD